MTTQTNNTQQAPINMVMVPQEEWTTLNHTIEELKGLIATLQSKSSEEWLPAEMVQEILGISTRTFLRYREKRVISYSQIGRKILVKRRDLDAFIETFYLPSIA